jgi:DNA-binding CsgD family transcriptional regulator
MPKYESAVRRAPRDKEPSPEPLTTHAELLGGAVARAGFDYYLMARFPRGDSVGFADNQIACNWPQELVEHYSSSDVFHCSRLVSALKYTNMPVFCEGGGFASAAANHESRALTGWFMDRGLRTTFAFSLHDAALRHYIFAFSGKRAKLSDRESMELVYGAMQILHAFARDLDDGDGPAEQLSKREIECLRWSAAGKSSEEIAIILDLSSHTVASYLKSAMRKLDSVNRMQAVARAFRYRLI